MTPLKKGLFALISGALSTEPDSPPFSPAGFYDPIEQLWRDHGVVVAQTNCTSPLLGGQVGDCMTAEECLQLPNSLATTSNDCQQPTPICCFWHN
jgi:hypothetical protein